jgi:hypothetical protein
MLLFGYFTNVLGILPPLHCVQRGKKVVDFVNKDFESQEFGRAFKNRLTEAASPLQ